MKTLLIHFFLVSLSFTPVAFSKTPSEQESSREWRTIFSGSTTSSIDIFPDGATEAFVITSGGNHHIIKGAPDFSLGRTINTTMCNQDEISSSVAFGTFSNNKVKGGVGPEVSAICSDGEGNNKSWNYTTAYFTIQQVAVR